MSTPNLNETAGSAATVESLTRPESSTHHTLPAPVWTSIRIEDGRPVFVSEDEVAPGVITSERDGQGGRSEAYPSSTEPLDTMEPKACGNASISKHRFKPIPDCSWECARSRPQKQFIGHTGLKALFNVPWWWPNWAILSMNKDSNIVRGCISPGAMGRPTVLAGDNGLPIHFGLDPVPLKMYKDVEIRTQTPQLPPREPHVVLGVFDDSERLLEEVLVYIGGRSRSQHLVQGRRRLFQLPILRDIRRFRLYKCDKAKRAHVRVPLTEEEEDNLAALFKCIQKWEAYYRFKNLAQTQIGIIPNDIYCFVIELWFHFLQKHRWVHAPNFDEEEAWTKWVQENISGGNLDPVNGQYSIECVLGWSRRRIIYYVFVPFLCACVTSIAFGIIWSFRIGNHEGDVSGGFTVASYITTLAAALVALVGIFGSLAYT